MKACLKIQQGQSESAVASFEPCPAVSDRPPAQVASASAAHTVPALPAVDAPDGEVGAAEGFVVLKDHHNKHS